MTDSQSKGTDAETVAKHDHHAGDDHHAQNEPGDGAADGFVERVDEVDHSLHAPTAASS